MYDQIETENEIDYDEIEYLPRGLRLKGSGQRKPSEVLDAMLPDLQFAFDKDCEGGSDPIQAYQSVLIAEGLLALAKSSQHHDLSIPSDDDQDALDESDIENHVMAHMIARLMTHLDDYTQLFMTYGWAAEDYNDPAFDELGVWINWTEIDRHIAKGTMITIGDERDLDDEDFVRGAMEHGAAYALLDDGDGRIGMFTLGQTCMQEWLVEP